MTGGESVKVAVLGAGAVGCFFGGMLARAGHRVTLIGRPVHVEAFRKSGLRFEGLTFDQRVPVEASTEAAAVRGARLVLFCVKSTDTEQAAAQIAPHLDADAMVVNLQNGVDNAGRIQGMLRAARVPVAISDNIAGELWAKLVVNCAYNALSAIAQLPYGKMIQGAGIRDVMRDVVEEALAVAKASGVPMAADMLAKVYQIAEAMPTQYSSTAQDLARGKPTEIDHLNGYVARRGAALGVPAPVNRALWASVKLLEAKPRAGS